MVSGFASIPRPACGSLPNEGCVGTSPGGLPKLRSTCANAIPHTSTTGRLGPAGRGLGGARGGIDLEAGSDGSDASRFAVNKLISDVSPNPGRRWLGAGLETISGGTSAPPRWCVTIRAGCGRSARGVNRTRGRFLAAGEVDAQPRWRGGRRLLRPRPASWWPFATSRDTGFPGRVDDIDARAERGERGASGPPGPRGAAGVPRVAPGWGCVVG